MRRGVLVIGLMGMVGAIVLSFLCMHFLEISPELGPLLKLRALAEPTWGDRLVKLTWALDADQRPMVGRAVRAIHRPRYGPDAPSHVEQHRELGRFLLQQYRGETRLEWADVRGTLDPETAWERVTTPFLAPSGPGDYPPRSSNPPPGAQPGAGNGSGGGER